MLIEELQARKVGLHPLRAPQLPFAESSEAAVKRPRALVRRGGD
jgi:hypothetical protein